MKSQQGLHKDLKESLEHHGSEMVSYSCATTTNSALATMYVLVLFSSLRILCSRSLYSSERTVNNTT